MCPNNGQEITLCKRPSSGPFFGAPVEHDVKTRPSTPPGVNLGKAIKVIETFETRLVAVEAQAQKIPELEQRVNVWSGEKDQLQNEKDLLTGEIQQL